MSRSRGAFWLTTSPPIRSSPDVMSSSPAIMFSAVDFPQPDGPTRIMNSPSAISRLSSFTASKPSGYFLPTRSSTMSAIASPPYPFTAPAVRPETMRRWKINTMMRIGIVTTTAPAAMAPLGSSN